MGLFSGQSPQERIAEERAFVQELRMQLAPEGVGSNLHAQLLALELDELLSQAGIPHAVDASRHDAPVDAETRHPQLHEAVGKLQYNLRLSGIFSPRESLKTFTRSVDELTPDASDEDRLRIVADALSAMGIVASMTASGSEVVYPDTIFVDNDPMALTGLTPNYPYDVPEGWVTPYEVPLQFEQLSPVGRIN